MSTTAYYRTHPEYQDRQRSNARRNAAKWSRYPEYVKVIRLRKTVCRIRDSYHARLEHAKHLERRLVGLCSALVEAEKRWKIAKQKLGEK